MTCPLSLREELLVRHFPYGNPLGFVCGKGGGGGQVNDFYLLIVNTAVLTLNLCYCIHVAIFLFTAAVFN